MIFNSNDYKLILILRKMFFTIKIAICIEGKVAEFKSLDGQTPQ